MSSSTIAGDDDEASIKSLFSLRFKGSLDLDLGVRNSNAVIMGLRGGLCATLDSAGDLRDDGLRVGLSAVLDDAGDLREGEVEGESGIFADLLHLGDFKDLEEEGVIEREERVNLFGVEEAATGVSFGGASGNSTSFGSPECRFLSSLQSF